MTDRICRVETSSRKRMRESVLVRRHAMPNPQGVLGLPGDSECRKVGPGGRSRTLGMEAAWHIIHIRDLLFYFRFLSRSCVALIIKPSNMTHRNASKQSAHRGPLRPSCFIDICASVKISFRPVLLPENSQWIASDRICYLLKE